MARGVDGRNVFVDDADRTAFLDELSAVVKDASADIFAYCLMGNHFHLAIRVGQITLSTVMQRVLTTYSSYFNRRHGRTGHLFQARYKAIICVDDAYLAALIRYIHMNPVRAGIAQRPEDWPWSSLRLKGKGEDSPCAPEDFDPWPKQSEERLDLHREEQHEQPSLEDIGSMIESRTGIALVDLRSDNRARSVVAAKRLLAREAVKNGHQLAAVAIWMNSALSSISRYARAE